MENRTYLVVPDRSPLISLDSEIDQIAMMPELPSRREENGFRNQLILSIPKESSLENHCQEFWSRKTSTSVCL